MTSKIRIADLPEFDIARARGMGEAAKSRVETVLGSGCYLRDDPPSQAQTALSKSLQTRIYS